MLICRFSGTNGPDQLMAPVARVRIVHGAIFANDERKPAAMYCQDGWQFRGQTFPRMSIEGPLVASLHDTGSGTPLHSASYRKVWFAGGALHAPSGVIATVDPGTQLWEDAATHRYAHELRVELRGAASGGSGQMEASRRW